MSKKKLFAAAVFFFTAVVLNLWVWFTPGLNADSTWLKLLLCLCVDGVAVLCVFNVETVLRVPLEILRDRSMFLALVKNDFQARFAGSYLGRLWAFVSPVVTILLYWFVFQFGL
ncbi:MAG: hypothetical protein IKZ19_08090, partial [Clostridia bacterium]|nr:hypothetical protein [Clostridia bacterium]